MNTDVDVAINGFISRRTAKNQPYLAYIFYNHQGIKELESNFNPSSELSQKDFDYIMLSFKFKLLESFLREDLIQKYGKGQFKDEYGFESLVDNYYKEDLALTWLRDYVKETWGLNRNFTDTNMDKIYDVEKVIYEVIIRFANELD